MEYNRRLTWTLTSASRLKRVKIQPKRVRALGHFAPSSYAAMAKLSSIHEEDGRPDWQTMVKNLAKGHEQVAKTAREVLAWMLRATAS